MAKPIKIHILGDATSLNRALGASSTKLGGFGRLIGGVAKVGGAAMLSLGVGGVIAAGKLDDAFNTIRVGTGATGEALDALEGVFKDVAATVPDSFGSVATAVADLNTRTGLTGDALTDLSEVMLDLSRITKTDVGANVRDITRVFGDWDIATGDQAATMDQLFRASQTTGIGLDQLNGSVVSFGAPLRSLGFGFDQSIAMLAKFEKEGVNSEAVLAGMKIGLGKMAAAGEEPAETFARLTEEIANASTAGEGMAIAAEAFGTRAGPDMAAAIREGRFELADLTAEIANGDETIAAATAATETWQEKLRILLNRGLMKLTPVLEAITVGLELAVVWIDEQMIPALQSFTHWVGDEVVPVLQTMYEWFNDNIIPVFQAATEWINDELIPAAQSLVDDAIDPLSQAVEAVTGWIEESLIPALEDVTGWFIDHVVPAIESVVAWINNSFLPALKNLASAGFDKALEAAKAVTSWFEDDLLPALKNLASAGFDKALEAAEAVAEWFEDDLLPALTDVANWIVDDLIPALQTMYEWFNDHILPVVKTLAEYVVSDLLPTLVNLATLGFDAVVAAVKGVSTGIESLIGWIDRNQTTALLLVGALGGVVVALVGYTVAVGIAAIASGIATAATGAFATAQIALYLAMTSSPIGIVVLALAALAGALVVVYLKSETFRDIVHKTFGVLKDIGMFMFDTFGPIIQTVIGAVVDRFRYMWSQFSEVVSLIKNIITGDFGAAFGNLKTLVSNAVSEIIALFITLPLKLLEQLAPLGLAALKISYEITKKMLEKLVDILAWFIDLPIKLLAQLVPLGEAALDISVEVAKKMLEKLVDVLDWFIDLPGEILGFAADVAIAAGSLGLGIARALVNPIIRGWNGLSFTLPAVNTHIPGVGTIGGWTLSTPNIPELALGGPTSARFVQVGERGPELLDLGGSQPRVINHREAGSVGNGSGSAVHVHFDGPPPASPSEIGAAVIYKMRVAGL